MSQMAQYHYQRDVAGLEKMISVEEGKLKRIVQIYVVV